MCNFFMGHLCFMGFNWAKLIFSSGFGWATFLVNIVILVLLGLMGVKGADII